MTNSLQILSAVIGWTYFAAWSVSFYPQAFLNYKRKSVQGLSLDFINYNVVGFLCYSIYNLAFFSSSEVQKEYSERNDGKFNLVKINDVVFALHALLISSFTLAQTFMYKRDKSQRRSLFANLVLIGIALGTLGALFSTVMKWILWIDFLYFLSMIKLTLSIIKYCPQAYINWKRKATTGWSIHNIILDFGGGLLSIIQLFLDAYIDDNWSGVFGNPVKLLLGNLSMVFDIIFLTQHYILYRNPKPDTSLTGDMADLKV